MSRIIIYSPCRLHVSVKDMRKFDLGHAGGGGIGISIANYTKIVIQMIEKNYEVISSPNKLVVEYFLFLMRKDFHIKGHYSINVQSNIMPHTGQGSTNTIIIGILVGLFHLNNIQINEQGIIDFYLKYVKEEYAGRLVECFETGVGPWCVLKGGMVVIDEYGNLAEMVSLPSTYMVLLVQPKLQKKLTIEKESTLLNQQGKLYDGLDYFEKEKLFQKIKCVIEKEPINFQRLFKLILRFQDKGSKKQEFISANKAYNGLLKKCQHIGMQEKIQLYGISSLGSTYFYVDEFDKLSDISIELGNKIFTTQFVKLAKGIEIVNTENML